MSDHAHDIKKEVKIYISVFVALAAFTVITVTISYFRLNLRLAIALALFVATVKASLVACYFMHLISERKLIYAILTLVVIFFLTLLFLPVLNQQDLITGTTHVS